MRFLLTVVLTLCLLGGGMEGVSATLSAKSGPQTFGLARLERVDSTPSRLLEASQQRLAPVFDPAQDNARRMVLGHGRSIFLPQGCRSVAHPYDLLVHFHGAAPAVEKLFARSSISGVLVVVNWGLGSGVYTERLRGAAAFERLLSSIKHGVNKLCPGITGEPSRIALSGWSAGYGAVRSVLSQPQWASRVDAVLLADGLHADFEAGVGRRIDSRTMAPFALFADEASAGRRVFALSHSSIPTRYASTTETADYLLNAVGASRTAVQGEGPRPGMRMVSRADRQGLHVVGFSGQGKQDHCDHLHAMGEVLLPFLKERWLPNPLGR